MWYDSCIIFILDSDISYFQNMKFYNWECVILVTHAQMYIDNIISCLTEKCIVNRFARQLTIRFDNNISWQWEIRYRSKIDAGLKCMMHSHFRISFIAFNVTTFGCVLSRWAQMRTDVTNENLRPSRLMSLKGKRNLFCRKSIEKLFSCLI